jgi:hypothetical protein
VAGGAPLELVNPRVVADARALGQRFSANPPFPHVVIDDFLAAPFARSLLDEFPRFERGNFIGDDGRPGPKSTFAQIGELEGAWRALDDLIRSPQFLALVGRLTGMADLLYDPFYLGGGTHENRAGASLDPHIDFNYHPSERWHRRLNLLLYLNPRWMPEWGGCLELYRDPRSDARPTASIVPAFNRCVIFETSERSWHGFDAIRLPAAAPDIPSSRKSIALYFYTKERPVAETAARHSTVYVQRPLPAHLAAGHTLTDADVDELRALLAKRDAYIDRQHAENQRLLQAQEHGLAGQVLYLMKRAYVRFRR